MGCRIVGLVVPEVGEYLGAFNLSVQRTKRLLLDPEVEGTRLS